ncbi:calcium uptake protein, mitochondrial-like isoform X3 [Rutidosis leptorrhynchoides]|uniref:calcium uptake protein, mitochondrial-like isoform X3 n=1 Tax=Rutidosis leptorrhynchoides TaxID=125765 RepID=UPI003A98DD37
MEKPVLKAITSCLVRKILEYFLPGEPQLKGTWQPTGDIRHKSRLLNHVDELDNEPHLKNICITFEEFKSFAELRKKLHPFSLAIFSYGKVNGFLTRKDFQRAANHTCVHSSYFRHSRGLLDTTRLSRL